jgi:hypothetical protein
MLLRLPLLLAASWLAGAVLAAATPAFVLLDRTSLSPGDDRLPGEGARVLLVQELNPRAGGRSFALPLAWFGEGDSVKLDASLSSELRAACEGLEAPDRLKRLLTARAAEAGEALPLLATAELSRLLIREPRGTDGAGLHRTGMVRLLTRGNVRDRWSVRPEIASPGADDPPVELPAPRLLQVDLVSFGLHAHSDDASLPPRFAHVGLRARLWNLREGRRDWDRALLVGVPVPDDGDPGGAFRARAEMLLDDAADRLAAELWPVLGLSFEKPDPTSAAASAPEAPSVNESGSGDLPAEGPRPDSLDSLLRRLAETRLTSVPPGDPWQVLARAVKGELHPALGTALACAEDPLGAAVETGSTRLGLGLAETYRRVEQSAAFRKALASDLLDQVVRAAGDDWPLERAARYLLSDLLEQPAPARDAPSVAGPLLQRARLDGARSPEGLASLLIGLRIWPEGGHAMLEELNPR